MGNQRGGEWWVRKVGVVRWVEGGRCYHYTFVGGVWVEVMRDIHTVLRFVLTDFGTCFESVFFSNGACTYTVRSGV